tara:strand:+ start:474 stop:623 length:150 start_codon:yes stop_codon:yes gene_type:complete
MSKLLMLRLEFFFYIIGNRINRIVTVVKHDSFFGTAIKPGNRLVLDISA